MEPQESIQVEVFNKVVQDVEEASNVEETENIFKVTETAEQVEPQESV